MRFPYSPRTTQPPIESPERQPSSATWGRPRRRKREITRPPLFRNRETPGSQTLSNVFKPVLHKRHSTSERYLGLFQNRKNFRQVFEIKYLFRIRKVGESPICRSAISSASKTIARRPALQDPLLSHLVSDFGNHRENRAWRRRRDSNPRYALRAYNGLANRRLQPLGHVSSTHGYAQDQRSKQPERRRLAVYTPIIFATPAFS